MGIESRHDVSERAIDTDAHFLESLPEIATYLDDDNPWKRRMQKVGNENSLFPSSTGDQSMFGRICRDDIETAATDSSPNEPTKPEDIPRIMDYLGLDTIVLLSHKMLSFARITSEDDRPVAIAEGYAKYMLDKVVAPREGIYTLLVAPYQNPGAAAKLIDEFGTERGIAGVCLITAGPEPPLGNHKYDPIYEATQNANLPVVFHSGGGGLDEFFINGYKSFLETHTLGFLWNNMAQLTSILVQGVPVKFPDLDIVFQESGIYWVPLMMQRLDAEYLKRQSEAPLLDKRPSEYMKEFYYGIQPLERPEDEGELESVVDMMGGSERLLYASDYPHWDYDPPSVITDRPFLSASEKTRILSGTAQKVFDI